MTSKAKTEPMRQRRQKKTSRTPPLFSYTAETALGLPCRQPAEYTHPLTSAPVCLEHWPPYARQFG